MSAINPPSRSARAVCEQTHKEDRLASGPTTSGKGGSHDGKKKSDFTEQEWELLRKGATGAGLLVSVSDRSFFDSFKEAGSLAKHLAGGRSRGSELERASWRASESSGFGARSVAHEIESETVEAPPERVRALQAKAPDEVEAYRLFVLEVAGGRGKGGRRWRGSRKKDGRGGPAPRWPSALGRAKREAGSRMVGRDPPRSNQQGRQGSNLRRHGCRYECRMGLWRYCVAHRIVGVAPPVCAQSVAAGLRPTRASAKFGRLGDYWISVTTRADSGAIKRGLGAPSSCHLVDSSPSHVTASGCLARRRGTSSPSGACRAERRRVRG